MDGGENVCAMVNRLESTMGVERRWMDDVDMMRVDVFVVCVGAMVEVELNNYCWLVFHWTCDIIRWQNLCRQHAWHQ